MTHYYTNSLKGIILLTNNLPAVLAGHKTNDLYKFIWIQEGKATLVVDHVEKTLGKDEFISLSPLHDIKIKKQKGNISTFIQFRILQHLKHDEEVSCNGLLFNGTSRIVNMQLPEITIRQLYEVIDKMRDEFLLNDSLEGEMLRLLLKRFIILCTRLAREHFFRLAEKRKAAFDIIRQYSILVDKHFKEKNELPTMRKCYIARPKLSVIFSPLTSSLLLSELSTNE